MSHIVDQKRIAVGPTVETVDRLGIALEERSVSVPRALLGESSKALFKNQKLRGL
jgi:hypothetical protein